MSMYALQVMTGMEAEITRKLRGKGVDARCPQERRMIRRGGNGRNSFTHCSPATFSSARRMCTVSIMRCAMKTACCIGWGLPKVRRRR